MNQNGDPGSGQGIDVGAQRVARVYAEALLNTAQQRGRAEEILQELEALVQDVFRRDPQFEVFLSSGAIGRETKREVLQAVFADRASGMFLDFLQVLNNHDRLDLLRPILTAYRVLLDERSGRVRVRVRSAVPLPADQQEQLCQELRDSFHLEPVLETEVDPDLLGGLVVQVGDWLYDGSVSTRIATLRKEMMERSSHEIQSRRDRFCHINGD